jgi:thiamine biosynthesis protein ThiS
MTITINGETHDLPEAMTVSQLLAHLGLDPQRLAVERNRDIVRRATFDETALAEGDVLEIVTLVGGG